MKFKDALSSLETVEGLSRPDAIAQLKLARALGDPALRDIPDFEEGMAEAQRWYPTPGEFTQSLATGVIGGAVGPFAKIAEAVKPGITQGWSEAMEQASADPQSSAGQLVGELAGLAVPWGTANKALSAVGVLGKAGLTGRVAGRLAGVSPEAMKAIRAGEMGAEAAGKLKKPLAMAARIERPLGDATLFGAYEAATAEPGERIEAGLGGAAAGAVLGGGLVAGGWLLSRMRTPLRQMLSDPATSRAFEFLSKRTGKSKVQIADEFQYLNRLVPALKKEGASPELLDSLYKGLSERNLEMLKGAYNMEQQVTPQVGQLGLEMLSREAGPGAEQALKATQRGSTLRPLPPKTFFHGVQTGKPEGSFAVYELKGASDLGGKRYYSTMNSTKPSLEKKGSLTTVELQKPFVVPVGGKLAPEEEALKLLLKPSKTDAAVMRWLETWGPDTSAEYTALVREVVARKAQEQGYKEVVYRSTQLPTFGDTVVVDLKSFRPRNVKQLQPLMKEMLFAQERAVRAAKQSTERQMQETGERLKKKVLGSSPSAQPAPVQPQTSIRSLGEELQQPGQGGNPLFGAGRFPGKAVAVGALAGAGLAEAVQDEHPHQDVLDAITELVGPARAEASPLGRAAAQAPRWVDTILESLKGWKQKSGTPEQVLSHLKGSKGAQEQMEFIGLPEFLEGKKSVTAEEVAEFVQERPVVVRELVQRVPTKRENAWPEHVSYNRPELILGGGGPGYREYLFQYRRPKSRLADYPSREAYTEAIMRGEIVRPYEDPHWDVEGFSTDLVAHARTTNRVVEKRPGLFLEEVQSEWYQGKKSPEELQRLEEELAILERSDDIDALLKKREQLRGIRARQFRSKDAEQILAQAENAAQSALEQAEVVVERVYAEGRAKWVEQNPSLPAPEPVYKAGKSNVGKIGLRNYLDSSKGKGDLWAQKYADTHPDLIQARKRVRETNALTERVRKQTIGVPHGPFEKSWPLLVFKRMLQVAAQEKKSWIGWTTGKQQAQRYGKALQNITRVFREDDPGAALSGEGNPVLIESRAGVLPLPPNAVNELERLAGKAIPEGEFSWDLTANPLSLGTGKFTFYDNEFTQRVSKFLRPYGAKVEQREMVVGGTYPKPTRLTRYDNAAALLESEPGAAELQPLGAGPFWVIEHKVGGPGLEERLFNQEGTARRTFDEQLEWSTKHKEPIFFVDIPEKLAEVARRGLPLFAAAGAVGASSILSSQSNGEQEPSLWDRITGLIGPAPAEAGVLKDGLKGVAEKVVQRVAGSEGAWEKTIEELRKSYQYSAKGKGSAKPSAVPKPLRQPIVVDRRGQGGAEQYFKFDQPSKQTASSLLVDPAETLMADTDFSDTITHLQMRPKVGFSFRLPWDRSDHPLWREFTAKAVAVHRELMTKQLPVVEERASQVLKKYNITADTYDDFFEAVEGLSWEFDGRATRLVQRKEGITTQLDEAARAYRDQVYDPALEMFSGIDRRAWAIARYEGLPLDKKSARTTFERLRAIQNNAIPRPEPRWFSENWRTTAERTRGMLNFDSTHDLDFAHIEGYITHQPVKNERTLLTAAKRELEQQFGSQLPGEYALDLEAIDKRLAVLDGIEQDMARKRLPSQELAPSKQFFGPISMSRSPHGAAMLLDKDIPRLTSRYLGGAYHKRMFDILLHDGKILRETFLAEGNAANAELVNMFLNVQRGVRGLREDEWIARLATLFAQKAGVPRTFTTQEVGQWVSKIMEFQFLSKVALWPVRFPIINATQSLVTTAPVTGMKLWMEGFRKALTQEGWKEAQAEGAIAVKSMFLTEIEGARPSAASWLIDAVQKLPNWTEQLNRVVTFHAGRSAALAEGFKPSPLLKTFSHITPKGETLAEQANRYGLALVDTTQFVYGAHGRPTAFTGSAHRRLWGQFKTFGIAYGTLFKDAVRHKQWHVAARMTASAAFFGGIGAVPGMGLFWDDFRRTALKYGIELPAGAGVAGLYGLMGIRNPLGPIDITQSVEAFTLPRDRSSLVQWAGGPTFGSALNTAYTGFEKGFGSMDTAKAALRAISPSLVSSMEAANEARLPQRFSNAFMGTDYPTGPGLYSPSGQMQAQRGPWSMALRGLNLQPSLRSQRYDYLRDIEAALEGGQIELVRELITRAREEGIIVDRRALSGLRGAITARQRGEQF